MKRLTLLHLKESAKQLLLKLSSLFLTPLSRNETRALPFLEELFKTSYFQFNTLTINGKETQTEVEIIYPDTTLSRVTSSESYCLSILPSGGICYENQVLSTGFDQYYNVLGYFQAFFKPKRIISGTILANWPQKFLTYGDFVLQLLPELCLIKSLLTHEEWSNSYVVLPHMPKFLFEYLDLLGCNSRQIVDSKKYCYQLSPESKVYFREKDIMWFLCAPLELMQITRNYLVPSKIRKGGEILFVERLGGYRRAIGLTESVRARLKDIGVTFFDPACASVKTQIETFANAKLVIGIHGAGLANLLWCQQGTKVIEIFNPSFAPWCYAILANQLGIDYYCLGRHPGLMDINFREADVNVDWNCLIDLINQLRLNQAD
jgi:hypothetical protein